ncbi:MAG: Imm10 family immunity protein [Polyangiaceae bacterium]
MISLEQYATVYVAMTTAMGNAAQEQTICAPAGFAPAQWHEAKNFYTARMMDPADAGRTAIAFSQAMQKGLPAQFQMSPGKPQQQQQVKREPPPPSDFTATKVQIYTSEYDVQMVELSSPQTQQHLVLQQGFEHDPSAESFNGNTFHVELNDQSHSIYGGVHGVNLSPGELTLIFDAEGQQRMGIPRVTIRFQIDAKMYAYLVRKLRFVFGQKIYVAPFTMPPVVNVNGLVLNDEKASKAVGDNMRVRIRTRLQPLKDTGRFSSVVYVTFDSTTIFAESDRNEVALFAEAEAALQDTFERDLTSVMAFEVTSPTSKRLYVYTSLPQQDFMARVNDALRTLPKLPVSFGGGEDAAWDNYQGCLADVTG